MNKRLKGKREFLKYAGDLSQLAGIRDCTLNDGRAKGVRSLDVDNGCGLEFTVLADRGLDISSLSYQCVNFSYISKTGICAPQYFNERGLGFLRSFHAGFLTTCGLTYVGSPCSDNGGELGLHGRISNTPAEKVQAVTEWEDGVPVMKVRGKMREAAVFAENLVLNREIICRYGSNVLEINDTVENLGFGKEPLMMLYHFNLGYPIVDECSYLVLPAAKTVPRDKEAEKGMNSYLKLQAPTPDYNEQVFYHDLKTDNDGSTFAALFNPEMQLGVSINFNKRQLDRFTQWKQMGEGEYVLGLEPCNCHVEGRDKAREDGTLKYINPGEKKEFDFKIEFFNDVSYLKELL